MVGDAGQISEEAYQGGSKTTSLRMRSSLRSYIGDGLQCRM